MEPTQDKPVRKRRRWPIVVILLASTLAWWYWPRGDARFVGKWRMLDEQGVDMSGGGELQLRSNGVWYGTHPPNTLWTLWSVEGDRFQVGTHRDAFGAAWLRKLSELVSKGRNRKLVVGYGNRYRIETVAHNEIQLAREPDGYRIKLVRVPE